MTSIASLRIIFACAYMLHRTLSLTFSAPSYIMQNAIHISLSFLFIAHPFGHKVAQHKPVELKKPTVIVQVVPPVPPPAPVLPPPPAPPPPPTFPVAPIGTYDNTYAFGNCTWYVAGRKNIPNSWGNADTWGERAAADGITVSGVPAIGAIAQRTGGLGHVAIVLELTDTEVHITEMNSAGFDLVDDRWMPISTYNYIYI